jgi:Carboxypeptidase regulatory-like domain
MLGNISACLMAILLSASGIIGQPTFGSIIGVVKDPAERTIADAQITLTNLDDHAQRNASADSSGAFEFASLKPRHYELVAHADGFSDYKISSLQLDARQNLRLDVALKLATSAQTIEVSRDRGPLINTQNGTIGDTKDFQHITALPVNYRGATTSPLAMLSTVPCAQQDANGNVSAGGGLPSQVQYSVDGSSTVNIRQNGALGNMNSSSELISEFKATQFNNNAEFAQLAAQSLTDTALGTVTTSCHQTKTPSTTTTSSSRTTT